MSEAQKSAEQIVPLGKIEEPKFPFQITHMDLTGPYNLTPRGNKYLLTFVDRFTWYVEAYPISNKSAEECARIYAAHIVTRHGTGSKLITDQGRNFVIFFFSRDLQNTRNSEDTHH